MNTNHPGNRILEVLRTFYPVPVFLYAWEELGTLVTMFYGSYWFTETLVRSDKLLFGVHHAMDPLIGSLWGGITFSIALKLVSIRGEDPLTSPGLHEKASRFKPARGAEMVMLKNPIKPL